MKLEKVKFSIKNILTNAIIYSDSLQGLNNDVMVKDLKSHLKEKFDSLLTEIRKTSKRGVK